MNAQVPRPLAFAKALNQASFGRAKPPAPFRSWSSALVVTWLLEHRFRAVKAEDVFENPSRSLKAAIDRFSATFSVDLWEELRDYFSEEL